MKQTALIWALILSVFICASCNEPTIIYQAKCGQQNIAGAQVYVDGTLIGYSTPARVKMTLSYGAHFFRMSHPEYGEWSDELHFNPGQKEYYVTGYFKDPQQKYAWTYGGQIKTFFYMENRMVNSMNSTYLMRTPKNGKTEYMLQHTNDNSDADYHIIKGNYYVGGNHYNAMAAASDPATGSGFFMNVSW